ncbi:hypothetical protein MPTK1_1g23210 [Marchantia polymorpha subsp. ruderalis]|uniref:Spherulation-specific family 4 n=2 Tax=Marchantia polymorpha TaxID=3197 RepID=A0A176WPH7_MARPO|nr:hypothetical protein AXG93_1864s1480 [Marchantia polymorpha subsp. ruderalis]PTQ36247.1 hypothetical protein MARPO_0065s0057 [Marchantia polymorpha]BBM99709.1 hypothetical protein Mp_1g23210 [Marchantia polymorpha subsp. ruderalis]|eukprot:PTQ36247.1 hypothetical protein MARPO_0065s0057 [Marchantia polymorpha]
MATTTTLTKLALALTLVHAVCASRQILQAPGCAGVSQYIIAPSYVYPCSITTPSCAWYSFSNGADIVIINPNSGPGTTANSDYVNLISAIRASTDTFITTILGYVATTYGAKSQAAVNAETDLYNSLYKVDGIFFDEASTDCTKTSYYSNIVSHVQDTTMSPTGQDYTILNWGTNGPECFLQTTSGNVPADNFVTFENSHASYASYAPLAYMANYAPARFYHIVYNVTQANLISTMTKSKQSRAGRVYVTNDDLPNPYDTAPTPFTSYWEAEVDKAASSC